MLSYDYISSQHKKIIEEFDCSDEITVELFLKERALNYQVLNSAVTRLYFDDNRNLVGYFTLHNDYIHIFNNQRDKHDWNLVGEVDYFPAIKIHYLGVSLNHRQKNYGEFLLLEALSVIKEISKNTGCAFATVEALNSAVGFYEKYGFVNVGRSMEFQNMLLKLSELD